MIFFSYGNYIALSKDSHPIILAKLCEMDFGIVLKEMVTKSCVCDLELI